MPKKEFEDISIPKRKLVKGGATSKLYRVFKSRTEFETVEADNATDAIAKSGIKRVFKIKFGLMDDMNNLSKNQLENYSDVTEPVEIIEPVGIDNPPALA